MVMIERGQIILILILVMTVALAIGLSVVQKSLVDISTASKVEQSSRAFSAAEAGIEKALQSTTYLNCTDCQSFTDNSSAIKNITDQGSLPAVPTAPNRQSALEFPPFAKEDVIQVWLADPTASLPNCTGGTSNVCYTQPTLDVYWGNSLQDKAALELTLVYYGTDSKYRSRRWYLDQINRPNGFCQITSCNGYPLGSNNYQCNLTLGNSAISCANGASINNTALPSGMMLFRARLLYNITSQPLAVQAVGTCGKDCSLPSQAREIISTGVSGETQRRVKLFQQDSVVPPYFDYAIFSAGPINK